MSLTAPVHPEPKQLFRWNNDFAWSYGGNVADSIAERVKKAGGKVEGATLRISLSWFNYDDLDLHVHEPRGAASAAAATTSTSATSAGCDRRHARRRHERGRRLDARGRRERRLDGQDARRRLQGRRQQLRQRETSDRRLRGRGGVRRQALALLLQQGGSRQAGRPRRHPAHEGGAHRARRDRRPGDHGVEHLADEVGAHDRAVRQGRRRHAQPNYWGDNAVGNKHTFFVLHGAKNDEPMRGIYNEFLHPRLEPHRKVFEVIGDKTKCQPTDGQLSGLGFSSTKKRASILRVQQGPAGQEAAPVQRPDPCICPRPGRSP
jgi:hypothetical protein